MKNTTCIATFIGGLVLGAAIAALVTPRTGQEVRESLRDLANKGIDKARNKYQEVTGKCSECDE